jgi:hypothetical protein
MRELPRNEAAVLHALKAHLGATVHRAGVAPVWDERRNTSLVRQTYRYDDYARDVEAREPVDEPSPEQMRLDP